MSAQHGTCDLYRDQGDGSEERQKCDMHEKVMLLSTSSPLSVDYPRSNIFREGILRISASLTSLPQDIPFFLDPVPGAVLAPSPFFLLPRLVGCRVKPNPGLPPPPYGTSPISKEQQDADHADFVARNTIVRVRKVNAGDRIRATRGKERGLGQEKGGESYCEDLTR